MKKRIISLMLTVLMVVSMLPIAAFSASGGVYEFTVNTSDAAETIGNLVNNLNFWDKGQVNNATVDELADSRDFVEYIQLMTATGGNADRDLFINPNDRSTLTDYDFSSLIQSCHSVLNMNAKPLIKLGNVPLKLSSNPVIGTFGVNVCPPDSYSQYYTYLKAIMDALVTEFGLAEVQSWRFGVYTEYENSDWFHIYNNGSYTNEQVANLSFIEFCKIYDYTVQVLLDTLGANAFVGAHSMTCTDGLWDETDFIRHCASGTNYANGGTGTRLCYLSSSYYDTTNAVKTARSLTESINILRNAAIAAGFNNLLYGVDEGRILSGTNSGASSADLFMRSVGYTWQGAYDTKLLSEMLKNNIDYFSSWGYTTNGAWGGYATPAFHVAERFFSLMTGKEEIQAQMVSDGGIDGAEVGVTGGWDSVNEKLSLMTYNFKHATDYTKTADIRYRITAPELAGETVTVTTWRVNDDANFFDEWQRDRKIYGIADSAFSWSPDDYSIDNTTTLTDGNARNIYITYLRESYRECSQLIPTQSIAHVAADGTLILDDYCEGSSAVFYEIAPSEELEQNQNGDYEISSAADLQIFADMVNSGSFGSARAILTSDITLDHTQSFVSVGTSSNPFRGTFDGQGHTITELYKTGSGSGGLFGYVNSATIEDVTIVSPSVSGASNVAAIVGVASGTSGVSRCGVIGGSITASTQNAASIVANVAAGASVTLTDCFSTASVTVTASTKGGGLVAWAESGATLNLTNCYYAGTLNVTAANSGGALFGGYSSATVRLSNSYSTLSYLYGSAYSATLSSASSVTAAVLKGYAATLGGSYAADTLNINSGYPVMSYTVQAAALTTNINGEYVIYNRNNLLYFANSVNSGTSYSGRTIVLANDIDLESIAWTPIGNSTTSFSGTFDGRGHSISGLYVNQSAQTANYGGFFGRVSSATIKNLGIIQPTITGYEANAALVGYANGLTVSSCFIRGGTISSRLAAGFVSAMSNSAAVTMNDCYCTSTITVSDGSSFGSAFVLTAQGASCSVSLTGCYFAGTLSVASADNSGAFLSGITSYNNVSGLSLTNCYTTAGALYNVYSNATFSWSRKYPTTSNATAGVAAATLKGYTTQISAAYCADSNSVNSGYPVLSMEMGLYIRRFNGNTGNSGSDIISGELGEYITLPVASKIGYALSGWYTAASGGTRIGGAGETMRVGYSSDSAHDMTLYAQWTSANTTVAFDNTFFMSNWSLGNVNSGTGTALADGTGFTLTATGDDCYYDNFSPAFAVTAGQTYKLSCDIVNPGGTYLYIFFYNSASDGQWSFSASAEGAFNTNSNTFTVPAGCSYMRVRPGILYAGTTSTFSNFRLCNTAYYDTGYKSVGRNSGSTYGSLPEPSRKGFSFDGWYTSLAYTTRVTASSSVASSGNITLYSKWSPATYAINYYDMGGSAFSGNHAGSYPTVYNYGTGAALDTPTKTGYNFGGWYLTRSGTGQAITTLQAEVFESDINLYAKWIATKHTAIYDANHDGVSRNILKAPNDEDGWVKGQNGIYTLTSSELTVTYDSSDDTFTLNTSSPITASSPLADTAFYSADVDPETLNTIKQNEGGYLVLSAQVVSGTASLDAGVFVFEASPTRNLLVQDNDRCSLDVYQSNVNNSSGGTSSQLTSAQTNALARFTFRLWVSSTGSISYNNFKIKLKAEYATTNNTSPVHTPCRQSFDIGSALGVLPQPNARAGYVFNGWNDSANGMGNAITAATVPTVIGQTVLYATWALTTQPITYLDAGGSAFSGTHGSGYPTTYSYNSGTSLVSPTKQGYNFAGWYLDIGANGTAVTSLPAGAYTSGITLYAKWTPASGTAYTVKHFVMNTLGEYELSGTQSHSGTTDDVLTLSALKSASYENGSAITYSHAQVGGSTVTTASILANGSLTVNLYYARSKYPLILVNGTGISAVSGSDSYYFGQSISINATVKSGYKWSKWTNAGNGTDYSVTQNYTMVMPAGNLTLTASATPINYTVTYELAGGNATNVGSYNIESSSFSLNAPTKTGYTFTGWTGSNGSTPEISVTIENGSTGDKNFTANWIANSGIAYTVRHYVMNTSGSYTLTQTQPLTGSTDEVLTLASLTSSDYIIAGETAYFQAKVGGVTATTATVLADGSLVIDLYYNRLQYTVTLSAGTGISSVSGAGTYYCGQSFTINAVVKNGYEWSAWTYTNGGASYSAAQSQSITMPAANLALTASASVIDYTIDYSLDGGAASNLTSYNVETSSFTLNNPTKTGFTFTGWTGSNGNTPETTVTIAKGSTGNKNYTANWAADTDTAYTVYHYIMNTSGNYVLEETQNLYGTTGETIMPSGLRLTAYEVMGGVAYSYAQVGGTTQESATILADGSLVVSLYYARSQYSVSLTRGNGIAAVNGIGTYYYDQSFSLSAEVSQGYSWSAWNYTDGGEQYSSVMNQSINMPAENLSLTATATVITYALECDNAGGIGSNVSSYDIETATFTLNNPTKTGYTFVGWTGSNGDIPEITVTVTKGSMGNKNYTANWSANTDTAYTVYHYIMNTSGNYVLERTEVLHGTTGDTITLSTLKKSSFEITGGVAYSLAKVGGVTVETAVISGDGLLDISLYYNRSQYTVTLSNGTGISAVSGSDSYYYGQSVSIGATVTDGYAWSGWTYTNDGTAYSAVKNISFNMAAGNMSLTANAYLITPYSISYSLNGGTADNPTSYYSFTETFTLIHPTKAGFEFIGWTGSNGNTPEMTVTIEKGSVGDRSYTANWESTVANYTVNHYIMDTYGTYSLMNTQYLNGAAGATLTLAELKVATYETGGVTYSYGQVGGATVSTVELLSDSTIVIDLYYARAQYNITLSKGAGIKSVVGAGSYYCGQSLSISATVATGYKWSKWVYTQDGTSYSTTRSIPSLIMPENDLQLTATTTLTSYTLNYELYGGTVTNPTSYNIETPTFTLNNPTRAGFVFTGWTGSNIDLPSMEVIISQGTTGNKYYEATWAQDTTIPYVVRHNVMDVSGEYVLTATVNGQGAAGNVLIIEELKNSTYEAANRIEYAYAKVGGSTVTTAEILADGSLAIDLYYDRVQYSVILTAGTGITEVSGAGNYYCGQSVEIDATVAKGYEWVDWTYTSGGTQASTQKYLQVSIPTYSIALTANAAMKTYTITYTLNGGSAENPEQYNVNTNSFTLNRPVKTGYTFIGWTGSNGSTPQTDVTIARGTAGNKYYTANWTESNDIAYTVRHYVMDTTGEYVLEDTSGGTGATGATLTLSSLKDSSHEVTGGIAYLLAKVGGVETQNAVIAADGSLIVDLYYVRSQYVVTLANGSGILTVDGAGTYYYGESVSLNATAANGYNWSKWTEIVSGEDYSLQAEKSFNMPAENVSLTALATVINYSIDYTLNFGSASNPESFNVETETFTLSNPTRAGYDFTGWTGSNGGTPQLGITIAKGTVGNKNYTANWSPIAASVPTVTASDLTLTYGYTSGNSVSVSAQATEGHSIISYQWYSNTENSTLNGSAISGETGSSYILPLGKSCGSYFYYCVVTAKRTDNNQTASASSPVIVFTVQAASGNASVSMADYTFGTLASAPVPTSATNGTANVTYLYTGTTNSGEVYSSATAPTQAGVYRVTASFGATGDYNATSAECTFTVERLTVATPAAVSGLVFNSSVQTGVIDGENYTLSGNTATAVGRHTATASLDDINNYIWDDGSTENQSIEWSIAAPPVQTFAVASNLTNLAFNGAESAADDSNYSATLVAQEHYTLPESITVTIGGAPAEQGTEYAYSSENGVVTVYEAYITGDIAITASGVANRYSITYYICYGTVNQPYTTVWYDYGEALGSGIEATDIAGYTFVEWTDLPETMPGENISVHSSYEVDETLSFTVSVSGVNATGGGTYGQYAVASVTTAANDGTNNFSYWKDADTNEIVSNFTTYRFYVHKSVSLVAVYGDTETDASVVTRITSSEFNSTFGWVTLYSERSIGSNIDTADGYYYGMVITANEAAANGRFEVGQTNVKNAYFETTYHAGLQFLTFDDEALGVYADSESIYARSYVRYFDGTAWQYVYSDGYYTMENPYATLGENSADFDSFSTCSFDLEVSDDVNDPENPTDNPDDNQNDDNTDNPSDNQETEKTWLKTLVELIIRLFKALVGYIKTVLVF